MCTTILRIDPGAAWPLLLAFVRDEERGRETEPPRFWWPDRPRLVGGRDVRAGGTWLAVDVGEQAHARASVAFVQNQVGPHVTFPNGASPSRGELPLRALEHGCSFEPAQLDDLEHYQPFHLVLAHADRDDGAVDWWQWSGRRLDHLQVQAGIHLVASRGIGMAGERERRANELARFAAAATPRPEPELEPRQAWGEWIDLLDGRNAQPDDLGGLVVHSVRERPGFGTVGASLVGIAADGRVRYDVNAATDLAPDGWSAVQVDLLEAARA